MAVPFEAKVESDPTLCIILHTLMTQATEAGGEENNRRGNGGRTSDTLLKVSNPRLKLSRSERTQARVQLQAICKESRGHGITHLYQPS